MKTYLRDGILTVFHTKSANDTAHLVHYIANCANEDETKATSAVLSGVSVSKRKRENVENPKDIYKAMLSIIPGMSVEKTYCI